MANHVDLKYADQISSRLERYRVKNSNPFKANFRCPYCLDSKKSQTKTRGWFLETHDNDMVYYCHNCYKSISFSNFLSDNDTALYRDYVAEKFISGRKGNNNTFDRPQGVVTASSKSKIIMVGNVPHIQPEELETSDEIDENLKKIKRISDMPDDHPAVMYVKERMIPKDKYSRFFYVPKFKKWTNTLVPNKFPDKSLEKDEPRLIIPFCDKNGKLFGYTGRSFDPDTDLRYVTIMIENTESKFYGLDTVDTTKDYYVFEGAIDSMFVNNSMAMAGADAKIDDLDNKDNCIIVYDNEPRNPEVHAKMMEAMKKGYRVVFWPDVIKQKDVNNMVVKEGLTPSMISDIVSDKKNQFTGLEGELKLISWRKVMERDEFNKHRMKEMQENANSTVSLTVKSRSKFEW